MLERLKAGYSDLEDIAFYHHEMAEANICKKFFNLSDKEYVDIQIEAHRKVLYQQGNTSYDLYHPTVKSRYPDFFR